MATQTLISETEAAELASRVHTSSDGRQMAWGDMPLRYLQNAARKKGDEQMAAYAEWHAAQIADDPAPPPKSHNLPPEEAELPMQIAFGDAHDAIGAAVKRNADYEVNALNEFLKAHPVVENESQAQLGAKHVAAARAAVEALEKERDGRVRPLNAIVKTINAAYKPVREHLEKLRDHAQDRLTQFALREEARRAREAEEAQLVAEAKMQALREAEEREAEARDNAAHGELGVDISSATQDADHAFADAKRAVRGAQVAEKQVPVRFSTGSGRALSMRTREVLSVSDRIAAVRAMQKEPGILEDLDAAILKAARAYRKAKGSLPKGIDAKQERSL